VSLLWLVEALGGVVGAAYTRAVAGSIPAAPTSFEHLQNHGTYTYGRTFAENNSILSSTR
jgi:hypothetical protein